MLTASDIGWGKYKSFEGPYFRGSRKFVQSASPTVEEKQLSVVTATEGGAMDAVNMYDQCIVSVGLIQWCEASYFLTSKLVGAVLEQDPSLASPLSPALSASGATFSKGPDGKWRFRTAAGAVDERPEQTSLFFLRSSGAIGSWDDESRGRAKLWAACFANFLAQDGAAAVQVPYTAMRLRSFATPAAAGILWDGSSDDGLVGAVRAAFISFAANLPAVASDHLVKAAASNGAAKWSRDWCVNVLRELTFGPGISIYPGRYDKIRPVMEAAYGVDLPDFAQELQDWRGHESQVPQDHPEEPTFEDPKEVQNLLIALGYDLGPSGADGKIGTKTMDAIGTFQGMNGLVDTRTMNVDTRNAMVLAWRKINPS
jgi:hypothetical protein